MSEIKFDLNEWEYEKFLVRKRQKKHDLLSTINQQTPIKK